MPVQLPGPRLPHDMAITPNYTILHDLPLFYDMEAFGAGRHKLKFHPELPSRFAVVPRHGKPEQIRWFEASPTYMYHVSNAWEEDDGQGGTEIVMTGTPFRLPRDVARQARREALPEDACPPRARLHVHGVALQPAHRAVRASGHRRHHQPGVSGHQLRDAGLKTRYAWNVLMGRLNQPEEPRFSGLARYDLERDTLHDLPRGHPPLVQRGAVRAQGQVGRTRTTATSSASCGTA